MIVELGLSTNLHHISYLGRELRKAEICLLSGKSYIKMKQSKNRLLHLNVKYSDIQRNK